MQRRRGRAVLTAIAAAGLSLSAGGAAAADITPASTPATINFGLAGPNAQADPLYVALVNGIFRHFGLSVNVQELTPTAATAAVLNGNVDLGISGPAVVAGILQTNSARVIASTGPTAFYLVASGSYKSVTSLKGQLIAATTPGSGTDVSLRVALKKAGLTAGTDVSIAYFSTQSAEIAALIAGKAAAAVLAAPYIQQAEEQGAHVVANVAAYDPPTTMVVNSAWASGHKATLLRFLKAFASAVRVANRSSSTAEHALAEYVGTTDPVQLKGSWTTYRTLWQLTVYAKPLMRQLISELTPPPANFATLNLNSIIDNSYMQSCGKDCVANP